MTQWLRMQTSPEIDRLDIGGGRPMESPGYDTIRIMGILNATPDSFSGDGRMDAGVLVQQGLEMIDLGADLLDIGGESSQPYASPVDEDEEIRRVLPVIRGLREQTRTPLSIDTYHVRTAEAAIDEGVNIVNDITGLIDADMRRLVSRTRVGVVIMHMRGTPGMMQDAPNYIDVVTEVAAFLHQQVDRALDDGIDLDKIMVDPGIGFGKTLEHNVLLIRNLQRVKVRTCPVLLGVSRKSMIGNILGTPVDQRLEGSLAAAAAGIIHGADMLRVHDVAETRRFVTVFFKAMGILKR